MNRPAIALKPLPNADRAESVMSALAGYIARSRLKPGDRLPAERELM
ncbi:MAG: GntR family transcriptional regulator, partial [Rhodospirillaceae bacterium]|nr:GntR family transcriptional regulator [Rhodospirillaceae bacterium]